MRTLAFQFIRVEVGNGARAFLWHDDWLRVGKLIKWSVRGQRSRHFQELHAKIQAEPVPDQRLGDDKFLWRQDTENMPFTSDRMRATGKLIGRRINPDWSDMLSFVREGASNSNGPDSHSLTFSSGG
ncbi:hypothetical protein F2Q69_00054258 [Brassica cretica]|uniref:Reverse transcriptase zinc-binding domain-containing protein n=1 Tax=Brassica cretica TaxID=69181 RepID=A0A8S9MZQ4_BRACR|nr:hypothetical protein F2Q69_00054258 [Brassica cretica]